MSLVKSIEVTDFAGLIDIPPITDVVTVGTVVETFEVSVDNGRFYLYLNGVEIYRNYSLTDGSAKVTFNPGATNVL